MSWAKFDDHYPDHPKVAKAGPLAAWLNVCAICYCSRYLTDGFVPIGQVRKLADVDDPMGLAETLVESGLWERCDGGFMVHDYLDYNPPRERVLAERESAKQRMNSRRSTEVRPNIERTSPEHEPKFNGPVPVPVPQPVPETPPPSGKRGRAVSITPEVELTAETLSEAPWINDELTAIQGAVARAFGKVESFRPRDGPFEAERFALYHAKKPPSNWYQAWLNWIKNTVRYDEERSANAAHPQHRGPGRGIHADPTITQPAVGFVRHRQPRE